MNPAHRASTEDLAWAPCLGGWKRDLGRDVARQRFRRRWDRRGDRDGWHASANTNRWCGICARRQNRRAHNGGT